jgi:adenylate cyclase
MSELTLDAIRDCMEGAVPATIATSSPAGEPNVAYLSQVEYVDTHTLALSFQFFNQTRRNVLANPVARLVATHPRTGARYRLEVRYQRTETAGPLFERMKAKLAGIASHTGMSGIFRLQGADIYAVEEIEPIECPILPAPGPRRNLLSAVRVSAQRLAGACDIEALLECALDCLRSQFDIHHALVLINDERNARLYTIASMGYEDSGVGSEIPLGHGVVGVAARERAAIRIGHATAEYAYGRAMREAAAAAGLALETEIPLPGLPQSRSQMAVPIEAFGRLIGALFVDSDQDLRFCYDDEDALVAFAGQLGTGMHVLQAEEPEEIGPRANAATAAPGATDGSSPGAAEASSPRAPHGGSGPGPDPSPLQVRHFAENDSVFLGEEYLIKGVAGAIFWSLAQDYVNAGRTCFSNRELRLDPRIRLPELSDNLEARLILLQKRLEERAAGVRLEKAGRGRFRLAVARPIQLTSVPAAR